MHVLAVLLIRLLGFSYLLSWVVAIPSVLAQLRYSDSTYGRIPNVWWSAVYPIIMSVLVIVLAHPIASLFVPKRAAETPATSGLTAGGALQVGTMLIGIFVLGTHVHSLLGMWLLGGLEHVELFGPVMWQNAIGPAIGIAIIVLARFAPKLLEWPAKRVAVPEDETAGD